MALLKTPLICELLGETIKEKTLLRKPLIYFPQSGVNVFTLNY